MRTSCRCDHLILCDAHLHLIFRVLLRLTTAYAGHFDSKKVINKKWQNRKKRVQILRENSAKCVENSSSRGHRENRLSNYSQAHADRGAMAVDYKLELPSLPPANQSRTHALPHQHQARPGSHGSAVRDHQFTRKNLKAILHLITAELKARGTKTPHIFLPFRSRIDDTKLEHFMNEIFPQGVLLASQHELAAVVKHTDEFTLVCLLKYMWSRLPNNEVIGWDVYLEYKRKEQKAGYPRNAFLSIMPKCLSSPAHASIVYDFLDILISVSSNSQYNFLSGRKIAKMASIWAFNSASRSQTAKTQLLSPFYDATIEHDNNFMDGLAAWKETSGALFHLLLSFLRAMLPDNQKETLKLPKTLQSMLVTNSYPPNEDSDSLKALITIPCVVVRTTAPSKTPLELLSKVRNTISFDKKDEFVSVENYTILKNIFRKQSTSEIVSTLTEESRRILKRVTAEPIESNFDIYPGWALNDGNTGDKDIPLISQIKIIDVTLQDYYIWTWLSSLSSDQCCSNKRLFGRSLVVEAGVKGFEKWLIVTEDMISPREYYKSFQTVGLDSEIASKQPLTAEDTHQVSDAATRDHKANSYKFMSLPPPPVPSKDQNGSGMLPEINFRSEDYSIDFLSDPAYSLSNDFQERAVILNLPTLGYLSPVINDVFTNAQPITQPKLRSHSRPPPPPIVTEHASPLTLKLLPTNTSPYLTPGERSPHSPNRLSTLTAYYSPENLQEHSYMAAHILETNIERPQHEQSYDKHSRDIEQKDYDYEINVLDQYVPNTTNGGSPVTSSPVIADLSPEELEARKERKRRRREKKKIEEARSTEGLSPSEDIEHSKSPKLRDKEARNREREARRERRERREREGAEKRLQEIEAPNATQAFASADHGLSSLPPSEQPQVVITEKTHLPPPPQSGAQSPRATPDSAQSRHSPPVDGVSATYSKVASTHHLHPTQAAHQHDPRNLSVPRGQQLPNPPPSLRNAMPTGSPSMDPRSQFVPSTSAYPSPLQSPNPAPSQPYPYTNRQPSPHHQHPPNGQYLQPFSQSMQQLPQPVPPQQGTHHPLPYPSALVVPHAQGHSPNPQQPHPYLYPGAPPPPSGGYYYPPQPYYPGQYPYGPPPMGYPPMGYVAPVAYPAEKKDKQTMSDFAMKNMPPGNRFNKNKQPNKVGLRNALNLGGYGI